MTTKKELEKDTLKAKDLEHPKNAFQVKKVKPKKKVKKGA